MPPALPDPYDLDADGLDALLAGEPDYRRAQVRAWLARGVDEPAAMTDLPAALRERLAAALAPPPPVLRHSVADDGLTHKVLLGYGHDRTADGGPSAQSEAVESVLMLYPRTPERRHARATVCISTQAGCAMGCPFCATGQAGFRRQLTFGEIVRQVTVVQRLLRTGEVRGEGIPDRVTNVVFMGMGEPLANLEPTLAAVRWLAADPGGGGGHRPPGRPGGGGGHRPPGRDSGFGLSARSITVSTVGLVPGIRRLTALGLPITLAVSLHAPNDALRDDLVPVNRSHPIDELLDACAEYRAVTGRRLTFEYVLIDGVNDGLHHAAELAGLVARVPAHVNLIPMNPTPAVPWHAPSVDRQRAFLGVLERAGVAATIRHNRGGPIDAACGQLYADYAMASGRRLPAAVGAADRIESLVAGGRGGR